MSKKRNKTVLDICVGGPVIQITNIDAKKLNTLYYIDTDPLTLKLEMNTGIKEYVRDHEDDRPSMLIDLGKQSFKTTFYGSKNGINLFSSQYIPTKDAKKIYRKLSKKYDNMMNTIFDKILNEESYITDDIYFYDEGDE